ncbi:MAG: hypothetical protein HXY34_08500 [Candidatus Thorarchaeota archaeon]|nr:hypothetical protein [Candidatus Thorarchaeota archaeon]
MLHTMLETNLTLDREIEDVKAQVQRELATIHDLLSEVGYRDSAAGWNAPFHVHRLQRALRIHYLALKIRESYPVPSAINEMMWDLKPDAEWQ